MKKYVLLLACVLGTGSLWAQALPKGAAKAKKGVFSVVTYTQDNKILNTGNGFYIDEKGTAVSDFSLFKDAHHAVVVTADGKELPVTLILGANDIYDVVKFRTQVNKKSFAINPAATGVQKGEKVFLLPYATQKDANGRAGSVLNVDSISNNSVYYTLNMTTEEKAVSCPVVNMAGEVIGLIQKNSDSESKESFALGINFASGLSINAMSGSDSNLNAIGIKKDLPDDESQALVMLYLMSTQTDQAEYLTRLNDFIAKFPESSEGYLRRATYYMDQNDKASIGPAEKDIKKAFDLSTKKEETHYNLAKLLYNYNMAQNEQKPQAEWSLTRALEEINKALQIAKEGLYYQTLADIQFALGKYAEAADAYSEVTKSPVVSANTFYSEVKARELSGIADAKQLVALMDSAVAFYKPPYGQEAAPYIYERGRYKSQAKNHRGAVMDYNTFHEAMVGQVTAEFYAIRADEEMACHMNQQAIDDITKATEMKPESIDFWTQKSGILIRLSLHKEAIEALNKAISLSPKDAGLYRMLGFCQIMMKQKKDGLDNLKKAIDMGDTVAKQLIKKYK